jgi:hypothetical protein
MVVRKGMRLGSLACTVGQPGCMSYSHVLHYTVLGYSERTRMEGGYVEMREQRQILRDRRRGTILPAELAERWGPNEV